MGKLATRRWVVFSRGAGAGLRPDPGGGKVLDEPGLRRRQGATELGAKLLQETGSGARRAGQELGRRGRRGGGEEVVAWRPQVLPRLGPPPGQVVLAPGAPSCGGKASESLSFYPNSSALLRLLPHWVGGSAQTLWPQAAPSSASCPGSTCRCLLAGAVPEGASSLHCWPEDPPGTPSSQIRVPAGVLSALLLIQRPAGGEGRW